MAIVSSTYAPNEWQFAMKAETTTGTASVTTMQKINVDPDSIVSMSQEVTQVLEPRSTPGRTVKFADAFVTDKGGHKTSVSVSGVFDTTIAALLLSNALGVAVTTGPASYNMAYNYAPTARAHGATTGTIINSFTFALVPPIASKTIVLVGCVCSSLEVTFDKATEGGRGHFSATFETAYIPLSGQSTPASMAAYGSTFRYLREFNAVKSINVAAGGAVDLVLNKVGYTINNNVVYSGNQGTNGDPELIQRAIPAADIGLVLGVKYDTNTEMLWDTRRSGSNVSVIVTNHSTPATVSFGITAAFCQIDAEVSPSGTDAGVFQDLSLKCLASTTGDIIAITP
jgi:hypothetical protein